ncbi:MAG: hypothetical protein ACRC2H_01485, partial [Silanimonas sp.]
PEVSMGFLTKEEAEDIQPHGGQPQRVTDVSSVAELQRRLEQGGQAAASHEPQTITNSDAQADEAGSVSTATASEE